MKKIKKLFTLIIFLFPFLSATPQTATIEGAVKDAGTKETLIGVNIVTDKNIGVITDINGKYSLSLDPGTHIITFQYVGYKPEKREISLNSGDRLRLNINIEADVRVLDAIVVSAGRFEQKISDVTVSMEIIKPSLIENNNIISLEDAIQRVPGVYVMDDQVSIRGGSGYSYGAGSRTLLLVDDIPMLTGASGEARWDFAPIENIHQVEIIKGASSALYGSSALNGVINIRTGFPGAKPLTTIIMSSGIYGNPKREAIKWWDTFSPFFANTRFSHSQRFNNFDLVIGGNVTTDYTYKENENEQRYRFNANLRYRDKKIKGLSYGVNANYMERSGDIFLLWLDGDSGVWRVNPSYQQSFHNTSFNIYPYITYYPNEKTRHNLKTRVYSIKNINNTEQTNYDDLYYAEYQFQKYLANNFTFTTGVNGTYNESISEIYGDRRHFGSNLALFSQVDKKLFDKLNLSFGARLEGYRIDEDNLNFRPVLRSGLSYAITKQTFIRSSFGMGYRYPTISEKFTATGAGGINIFPNHYLKDETGWSAEIGIKRGFNISEWNGYIDVAGFWTEYKNMIEFMFGYHNPDSVELIIFPPDHPNYFTNWVGFKAENVRNARITGVDISVVGDGKFFGLPATLLAGYTYTNPIDMDANKLMYKSLHSTSLNILKYRFYHNAKFDFEIKYKKVVVGFNAEYCSHIMNIDKAFEDTVRFPNGIAIAPPYAPEAVFLMPGLYEYRQKNNNGYVVFDARLGWSVSDNVRLTASIRNLFNKEYMMRPADVRAPRTYIIQLNIKI